MKYADLIQWTAMCACQTRVSPFRGRRWTLVVAMLLIRVILDASHQVILKVVLLTLHACFLMVAPTPGLHAEAGVVPMTQTVHLGEPAISTSAFVLMNRSQSICALPTIGVFRIALMTYVGPTAELGRVSWLVCG